jgi:tetratricopeptide (TPR) repeat protein
VGTCCGRTAASTSSTGATTEALALLNDAFKNEPVEPPQARTRSGIRTDLGAAMLALAHVDEAQDKFEKALQADPSDSRPLAGKLSSAYYSKKSLDASTAAGKGNEEGFDLLMARALLDVQAKEWKRAKDQLELAANADPLHAARAWAALSWLAEVTGYPDNAVRYIERAVEGDPTDPWTRYQHGRLLAARERRPGGAASSSSRRSTCTSTSSTR